MEIFRKQGFFIISVLMLSVVMSGCSRQYYTALVSSDGESGRTLVNRSDLTASAEGLSSQQTSSTSQELGEREEQAQVEKSDYLSEDPPIAYLRDSHAPANLGPQGAASEGPDLSAQNQSPRDFHRRPSGNGAASSALEGQVGDDMFLPGMENIGERASQDEFQGEGLISQAIDSSSSASEEITPLEDKDLLTEMAAASGTSNSSGLDGNFSNSRRGNTSSSLLGSDLFKKGNLGDIFFDFDAVAIRSDAESVLEANARILKSHIQEHSVVIEGHCDERGTAEYNLVLGERRAQTTKQYLVDLGVSSSTIQIVSYGKEKPFCTGSQPDCWKMNRRGHFVAQ